MMRVALIAAMFIIFLGWVEVAFSGPFDDLAAPSPYDYLGQGAGYVPQNDPIVTEQPRYHHPAIDKTLSPYSVEIGPGDDHFADVTFQNRLVYGPSTVSDVTFIYEGVSVRVLVDSKDGDEPDTMTVFPPPGYYTIPESVTVDEDAIGVIEIHQQLMF